jgi:penicillin-binding protein 2
MIKKNTTHDCKGIWDDYGEQWSQKCWIYPNAHNIETLEGAIRDSCDIYFYNVGADFYEQWRKQPQPDDQRPNPFQDYVRTWGFGSQTGVDLPGEAKGRIPDASWKAQAFSDTPEDAVWRPGDMTNMVIGQGDILVTPLQIANGYCTVARGSLLTPHVLMQVQDAQQKPVVSWQQPSITQPTFDPAHLARVRTGLRLVIETKSQFDGFPIVCAGKSGTGQATNKDDYSWFVAYGPVKKPKYCVACLVEQGGGGSTTAIEGVLHTLAAAFKVDVGEMEALADNGER